MKTKSLLVFLVWFLATEISVAQETAVFNKSAPQPFGIVDGEGPGWKTFEKTDFVRANCDEETFTWEGTTVRCTGKPVGVLRSVKQYKNFEFVAYWRHLSVGGNSGFFVWAPEDAFQDLLPGKLPKGGIEVQILDHGYAENYLKKNGKQGDWFTTHGDVFPVGSSTMTPFEPVSPKGARSFPRENRGLGSPEWNHYYVRAINGEIRLWVNGREVSGGRDCNPSQGYLCLESEGAPIEWKDIRARELP